MSDLLNIPLSPQGPTRTSRVGRVLARRFVRHMAREMDRNAYKGDSWNEADPVDITADLIYHAIKLARAVHAVGAGKYARAAALEFAADVANLAAMVADNLGVVDLHDGLIPLSPALGWGDEHLKALANYTCATAIAHDAKSVDY